MTIDKKVSIQTFWSEEDQGYVARCDEYPSLSWVARTADKAVTGLKVLIDQVDEDITLEQQNRDAFDADIIDEKLDDRDRILKAYIDERIVSALVGKRTPQQRPDLFWTGVKNIIVEKASDTPIRLMNFVASYAKEQGIQGGEEMYQQASDIYRSSFR